MSIRERSVRSKPRWQLRLYICGGAPRSLSAVSNLQRICENHLKGLYTIEVIDLSTRPELAGRENITVLPTLVRQQPAPLRKVIGDLSDETRVVSRMGMDANVLASSLNR